MSAHPNVVATFPKTKFLGTMPVVYDQGDLGSCTANALAAAFEYEQVQQGLKDFMPSRLFIYYNERQTEGTIEYDAGASLSDGIQVLTTEGVCSETLWPYDVKKFTVKPNVNAYKEATSHQVIASRRVPINVNGFKTILNMGYPIVFGFTVFSYMETPQMAMTGVLKMPDPNETPLGGHAVVCVGYSDTMTSVDKSEISYFKVRNSWGPKWGQQGYFWIPYRYIDLFSDAWVITKNEGTLVKLNKEISAATTDDVKV
jgi:C1A family cysteine protease